MSMNEQVPGRSGGAEGGITQFISPEISNQLAPVEQLRVQHDIRARIFENVLGVDAKGQPKTCQVIRDAVATRLDDPHKARFLTKRYVFSELHGARDGVEQVLDSQKERPMDTQALALELRPRIKAVYSNRKGGIEEFDQLTDAQVVADAQDFSGTVARELFLKNYLDTNSKKQQLDQNLQQEALIDLPDQKLNKFRFVNLLTRGKKLRNQEARELGRVSHRLKFNVTERQMLTAAVAEQNTAKPAGVAPLTSQDRLESMQATEQQLYKEVIQGITGDTEDKALTDMSVPLEQIKYADILSHAREKEALFRDAAAAREEIRRRRERLAKTAHYLHQGDVTMLINDSRKAELDYKGLQRGMKAFVRQEKGRIKLAEIRQKGLDRLQVTTGTTIGDALKETGQEVPFALKDTLRQKAGQAGEFAKSLGEQAVEIGIKRPINFIDRGVTRVMTAATRRAGAQIDRITSFGRMRAEDFRFWKGSLKGTEGKMEQSREQYAHRGVNVSASAYDTVVNDMNNFFTQDPESARRYEEFKRRESQQLTGSAPEPTKFEQVTSTSVSSAAAVEKKTEEAQPSVDREPIVETIQEQQAAASSGDAGFGEPKEEKKKRSLLDRIFRRNKGEAELKGEPAASPDVVSEQPTTVSTSQELEKPTPVEEPEQPFIQEPVIVPEAEQPTVQEEPASTFVSGATPEEPVEPTYVAGAAPEETEAPTYVAGVASQIVPPEEPTYIAGTTATPESATTEVVQAEAAVTPEENKINERLQMETYNRIVTAMKLGLVALKEDITDPEAQEKASFVEVALREFDSDKNRETMKKEGLRYALTYEMQDAQGNQQLVEMPFFTDMAGKLSDKAEKTTDREQKNLYQNSAVLLIAAAV